MSIHACASVTVTRISLSTIVWAHKEKCLAFSLALSRGSKFLLASLDGLAQSRKIQKPLRKLLNFPRDPLVSSKFRRLSFALLALGLDKPKSSQFPVFRESSSCPSRSLLKVGHATILSGRNYICNLRNILPKYV